MIRSAVFDSALVISVELAQTRVGAVEFFTEPLYISAVTTGHLTAYANINTNSKQHESKGERAPRYTHSLDVLCLPCTSHATSR